MSVTVYEPDGTPLAGDPAMSDAMKKYADEVSGYVTDDRSGDMLHDARAEASGK